MKNGKNFAHRRSIEAFAACYNLIAIYFESGDIDASPDFLEGCYNTLEIHAPAGSRIVQNEETFRQYLCELAPVINPDDYITYSLNQQEYLCVFLDHGEIEISNNQVENAIRPIVVGRKNWLFCSTQAGTHASVTVFSVLETAKANGLNPEAYLNHLLTVLPERFAVDCQASLDDLMP